MTSALFLGGIFNIVDPVFGLQIYLWGWLFLFICMVLSWIGWYYKGWKPYEALHGLYYAMKNGSTVAFIFDAHLVGEMVAERDAKCIFRYAEDEYEIDVPEYPIIRPILVWFYTKAFYYPTKYLDIPLPIAIVYKIGGVNKDVEIARHLENGDWERSASVVCTGVPVDIIVDMDNWTVRGSKQNRAIVETARKWNELNQNDQIHSYRKFQHYILTNMIPCPQELRPMVTIPWQRIDAAFPLDLEENEWAGKKRQMAADMEEEDSGDLNRFIMWILIGGLGMAALILLLRFGSRFIH